MAAFVASKFKIPLSKHKVKIKENAKSKKEPDFESNAVQEHFIDVK